MGLGDITRGERAHVKGRENDGMQNLRNANNEEVGNGRRVR